MDQIIKLKQEYKELTSQLIGLQKSGKWKEFKNTWIRRDEIRAEVFRLRKEELEMVIMAKNCELCGANRWRTVKKNEEWQCTNCGTIRKGGEDMDNNQEDANRDNPEEQSVPQQENQNQEQPVNQEQPAQEPANEGETGAEQEENNSDNA